MAVPQCKLFFTKLPVLQASRWFVKSDQVANRKSPCPFNWFTFQRHS